MIENSFCVVSNQRVVEQGVESGYNADNGAGILRALESIHFLMAYRQQPSYQTTPTFGPGGLFCALLWVSNMEPCGSM